MTKPSLVDRGPKRKQVESAPKKRREAKLIKRADKTSNVRVVANSPAPDWGKRVSEIDHHQLAPVWCGTVCHDSDIAGLVRALNEFCFTSFLRRALDLLTLGPSINQRRFGHLVWINCQSGFCLCLSGDRDGRGLAPSSFPPRKTSRKCACTQPPATDGTSLGVNGWLEGSPP